MSCSTPACFRLRFLCGLRKRPKQFIHGVAAPSERLRAAKVFLCYVIHVFVCLMDTKHHSPLLSCDFLNEFGQLFTFMIMLEGARNKFAANRNQLYMSCNSTKLIFINFFIDLGVDNHAPKRAKLYSTMIGKYFFKFTKKGRHPQNFHLNAAIRFFTSISSL